jgi:DNA-binding NarL/FixJ family response regulator
VMVVDDHELLRGGLVTLLQERGIEIVGEAGLGREAIALAAQCHPDVVLMDLNLPDISGVEATRRLVMSTPSARVVVLTVMADQEHVTNALLAGACGYLLKDSSIDQIVEGIQVAARGESLLSPRIVGRLVARLCEPGDRQPMLTPADLSRRQLEVLELLVKGMDNLEIAHTLFLSEHTVKNHVSSILAKLGAENRVQAAVQAVRGGLV